MSWEVALINVAILIYGYIVLTLVGAI